MSDTSSRETDKSKFEWSADEVTVDTPEELAQAKKDFADWLEKNKP